MSFQTISFFLIGGGLPGQQTAAVQSIHWLDIAAKGGISAKMGIKMVLATSKE